MKRILIVTQYIYPETFKSSEMAFELVKRGYKVDVLTGIPNYPEGHFYKGYGIFTKRKEIKEGVSFYRCFQTPRKLLPGFIGLSLNFVTFAISSTFWVLFYFAWKKRYDVIIAHEPSPITQIIPACILGKIKGIPVYSWIQDIWPDSVISTIGRKGIFIQSILQYLTDWIYENSTKILVTSKGMIPLINRTRDYSEKIIYYPQWSEEMYRPSVEKAAIDAPLNIMMVGSLNDGIGVSAVLALCKEMASDNVKFTFVGGGSAENNMREYIRANKLSNVTMTGRQPLSMIPVFCSKADAMLLTLKETKMTHLKATVPARLQAYLSAAKPVLAMIDGSAADIIAEADCGHTVPAGDYMSLANYIRNDVLNNREVFYEKGVNARKFYLEHFTKEMCIDNLVHIIESK